MEADSGFGSEVERRRRAVELVGEGVSKTDVAVRVGRSRWWVNKWFNRKSKICKVRQVSSFGKRYGYQ